MPAELEKQAKDKMDKAIAAMEAEFATLRTGRASAALLDGVVVPAYGAPTPIKQIASISTPDAKSLVIQPWDKNLMPPIEKAILAANLGFTPMNDGKVIRINIPALTEERRKELVKLAHRMAEQGRVAVRNVRRLFNDDVKKVTREGEMSEDDRDDLLDKIQKATDKEVERIDALLAAKEKEIMEV
ncbi:MAG: ribosome recycling factor [Candidatus Sumerlaeota bacterium]|nr:ribosome recycling factor [Candidatus Sumerlaeota bacterium]